MSGVNVLDIEAAVKAAHDPTIVRKSLTCADGYSPYCMRCSGMYRMVQVGFLHWKHHCGAEHDESEARAALRRVKGDG